VPETDAGFAELPAEIHFLAAVERGEIDQSGFYVFDLRADFLDALDCLFQTGGSALLALAAIGDFVVRRDHASGEGDALVDEREFGIGLIVRFLELDYRAEKPFDFRQVLFGFEQVEESWQWRMTQS
jgi:hypothetical protein